MAFRQLVTPNLNAPSARGWCLWFVDNAVNAPNRMPSAQAAYNKEAANGNTRNGEPPVGVWVPIFFSFLAGQYTGLGHVAWAFNHGNGWIEIHDSETRSGVRAVYRNINEVLTWFGAQSPKYLGWSVSVDGVRVVEEYTPVPTPNQGLKAAKGTARVIVDSLNVRNSPDTKGGVVGVYSRGTAFNYDGFVMNDGYVWLSYISFSGVRRYVAEGPANGIASDVYVSGGVSR